MNHWLKFMQLPIKVRCLSTASYIALSRVSHKGSQLLTFKNPIESTDHEPINLNNCEKKAEKNQGFNGIQICDFYHHNTSAMVYQRSYQASHLEPDQFCVSYLPNERIGTSRITFLAKERRDWKAEFPVTSQDMLKNSFKL